MADGDVVIRLRDVYDIATRTEQKVELLILAASRAETTGGDHETRLRTVEKRLYALPSIATLIAAAALVVAVLGLNNGVQTGALRHQTPGTEAPVATTAPQRQVGVTAPQATVAPTAAPRATQPRSVPTTPRRATTPTAAPVQVTTPRLPVPVTVPPLAVTLGRLTAPVRSLLGLDT